MAVFLLLCHFSPIFLLTWEIIPIRSFSSANVTCDYFMDI